MPFRLSHPATPIFESVGLEQSGHFDTPNSAGFDGDVVWVDTVTPAAGYSSAATNTYQIELAVQTGTGVEQDAVLGPTTTEKFPFVGANGGTGAIAGVALYSNANNIDQGGLFWWAGTSTPGQYTLDYEPLTYTPADVGTSTPAIALSGRINPLIANVPGLYGWTATYNSTTLLYGYSKLQADGTINVNFEGFTTHGNSLGHLVTVGSHLAKNTPWTIGNDGTNFYFEHAIVQNSTIEIAYQGFNPNTGAISAPGIVGTDLTGLYSFGALRLADNPGRFFQIVDGTNHTGHHLEITLDGYSAGSWTTYAAWNRNLYAAPTHWSAVELPGDYLAVAFTDNGHLHLDLINSQLHYVTNDLIIPGLTDFTRFRAIGNGSVEFDYVAANGHPATVIYNDAALVAAAQPALAHHADLVL